MTFVHFTMLPTSIVILSAAKNLILRPFALLRVTQVCQSRVVSFSFAPLPEEFVNVLFGDAEHFCNLLIGAKLLINCINDLLAQFYGIRFHTP